MIRLLYLLLTVFSFSVFADSYTATYAYSLYNISAAGPFATPKAACDYYANTIQYAMYGTVTQTSWQIIACDVYGGTNNRLASSGISPVNGTCPYGGTIVSAPTCSNAPPCTAPATRDSSGQCVSPSVVCDSTHYNDTPSTCAIIPDCNTSSPDGGNFFNKTTKSCQTVSPHTVCIGTTNIKYCPPIDDCKPAGFICSDDAQTVADANATRALQIAATKALADAKKAQADQLSQAAADAAAAKANSVDGAKAARDAAATALATAKASGDQTAIAAAVKAFAVANDAVADALARASNSAAAKTKASTIDSQIGTEDGAIPTSNPGNAASHNTNIDNLLPGLSTALDDAVSGDGTGTGRGSGVATSTSSPSTDTSGLAKDGTAQQIAANTKGILDALNASDSFTAGNNVHGNGKTDGKTAISSVLCQGDCASSPTCSKGSCSPSERIDQLKSIYSLDANASGECPPINIDLSSQGFGNHTVSVHCDLMESVRSAVTTIMTILISISFIFILMSA